MKSVQYQPAIEIDRIEEYHSNPTTCNKSSNVMHLLSEIVSMWSIVVAVDADDDADDADDTDVG